ncbi:MAG: bifunctional ornithine acetyltransferase/N-acetylglutamate synthase [bacterium]|nr:bifunctional ornithine acetyltransferase/N-acetylglutamate synthase [bacterium]
MLSQEEIKLNIDLGMGKASATVWTCDLTYDYVKINARYHT